MQYVKFPKSDIKVSRFGMGCMRFPKKKTSSNKSIIDEEESIKMIEYAVENGVNYFDTAYVYAGSEVLTGKALRGGLREKIFLATKSPLSFGIGNSIEKPEDFDVYLNEQLHRLRTEYIDFYLLHGLNKNTWEKVKKLNLLGKLDAAKKEGKIVCKAFSFHDDIKLFKEIIDSYNWDMCQIQLNFLEQDFQAGVEGLQYAASKNIGVVIMEPLIGGFLGANVPKDIIKTWDSSGIKRSPVEWAFRWLANFPQVTTILSGVSSMAQLEEDIKIFDNVLPNILSEKEEQAFKKVKELYDKKLKVKCTGCSYCMPCPSMVNIPDVFLCYNKASLGDAKVWKEDYKAWHCKNNNDASQCTECGRCEEICPQHIPVIDKLKETHEYLMS
jgi:uncharacterized protein